MRLQINEGGNAGLQEEAITSEWGTVDREPRLGKAVREAQQARDNLIATVAKLDERVRAWSAK